MKKYTHLYFLILSTIFISSCSPSKIDYQLQVVTTPWGFGQESEKNIQQYEVTRGRKIAHSDGLSGLDQNFYITIESVKSDRVTIQTSEEMVADDWQSPKTRFELPIGTKLQIMTKSYDAGYSYQFELISNPNTN